MREIAKRMIFLSLMSAIVLMVFQLAIYRQYTFEATWLQFKNLTGMMSLEDQRKLGAICNSLELTDCSIRMFTSLIKENPSDIEILSNLAMALALKGKFIEAEPYFKAYFASGGNGYDVMYSYGKTLRALDRDTESIPWFYNVLYYQPGDQPTAKELFDVLQKTGRLYEAQSFLASLIAQTPNLILKAKWQLQLEKLQGQMDNPIERQPAGYMFPALDGRHFYLPVKNGQGSLTYMSSSEDDLDTQLSHEDVIRLGLKPQMLNAEKAVISSLHIGPFKATNFEVKLCEQCESRIGGRLLSKFSARIEGRGKVPYLIIDEESQ